MSSFVSSLIHLFIHLLLCLFCILLCGFSGAVRSMPFGWGLWQVVGVWRRPIEKGLSSVMEISCCSSRRWRAGCGRWYRGRVWRSFAGRDAHTAAKARRHLQVDLDAAEPNNAHLALIGEG